jgi:sugar/nucleoside kinase (ribokinase family)
MAEATTFDIIAIGDTTQDIFLGMSDASVQCDLNGKDCKICFDYANKIAVDTKTDIPAVGNAANHAIGVARQGLRSALYTMVGDDVQGHLAHDVLHDEGVETKYVQFDPRNGTNFSAVINYKGERTIFVYHEPRDYRLPQMGSAQWIYLTSASGDGVQKLHQQVLSWLMENPEIQLSFNPGTYQMKLGIAGLKPLLARCGILFLNREEAARVLEVKTEDVKELIAGFLAIGVKTMVLTDGPKGAYASDGETIWYLDIFDGPVVERTGCGDAFGSGFMGALITGKNIQDAMLYGNANSTSVLQYIGARAGLLTIKKMEEMIRANPNIKPQEFAKL